MPRPVTSEPENWFEKVCFYMTEYTVPSFKGLDYQPFEKYIGKVVRIKVKDDPKGITGRLAVLTDRFIELIHMDGRNTIIRIDEVVLISPVRSRGA